ncbi:large-conductance mechanosensitive channel protein MscL [Porphyromonas cangingivalis]|uniref:Large-conductance mechanosensitive channel n=1 Tax=Porphyromonas cangingivalis TaxID=36874 RepID=A0A0A2EZP3_PORCN|nr:large-conductance mechanosensitive channel [Porphyromonas cangingivalis]SPY34726.1 Large-conductance mechanosensitive channel [Porphyromonas cangingivalis]
MGLIKEFKEFAVKGNVVDMAVGIIIGGAFGKIVSSLVNDVIMPPIGKLIGGVNFTDLKIVLSDAVVANGEVVTPEVAILYGSFIQTVIDFLIIAFVIFMAIKAINKLKREKPAEPEAPAAPPADVQLLTEIRDLLKKQQ